MHFFSLLSGTGSLSRLIIDYFNRPVGGDITAIPSDDIPEHDVLPLVFRVK